MKYVLKHIKSIVFLAIVAVGLAAGFPAVFSNPPAHAQDGTAESIATLNNLSDAFVKISADSSAAVVSIRVKKDFNAGPRPIGNGQGLSPEDFFERFFGPGFRGYGGPDSPAPGGVPVPYGEGTGFVLSEDGYVVTNHHVIDGADEVEVRLPDGREFDAEVVGTDPQTEVALIKVDASGLPTLKLGDSNNVRVGEWVVAIGSPFGLSHTVTAGIVSARGRSEVGIVDYADFIQTDAAINPGNSGGPLLNLRGEVVGMNTAILSRSGGNMGIGFAIPINMVQYIVDQLRTDGKVSRGFLGIGIQNLTPELADWFKVPERQGVLIASVEPDSPAASAGLQRDDVIVALDGNPVTDAGSFRSHVATTKPGNNAELTIVRNGERITKPVTVGMLEGQQGAAAATGRPETGGGKLGISLQNLTDDVAQRLGYTGKSGVLIADVMPNSAAAMAGLEPGMLILEVNRKPVRNVEEFKSALAEGDSARGTLLLVSNGDGTRYVNVKP
ncbi:MAG: DegQ family serine endoprotease [Candidatus Hydrogenedentes bacterium]|nr:DegQ family serine endoprotease [Candidatus Hydrogenedentota bacterium]